MMPGKTEHPVPAGERGTIRKAIILAAGVGSRLRPHTDVVPKCLVPVNGVPILVNALSHLAASGVEETVIVVGHLKEKIFRQIGSSFGGMTVTYVASEKYATTNNIYSLWLAREHLDDDALLLEADIFFERKLLDRMLAAGRGSNLAAVAPYQPSMSGTVARIDEDGSIHSLVESRHQGREFDYSNAFKTVNIYRFGAYFLRHHFVPMLQGMIDSEAVQDYYETILRALCHRGCLTMSAVDCGGIRWVEIDTQADLTMAEYLFATPEQRYDFISAQHGDFWRYGFADHALLYNLYFPPQEVFDEFSRHVRDITLHYPPGQAMLSLLMGTLIDQPPERIVVGNGASELIKALAGRLGRRLIVPVPSFNEWVNAAPEGQVIASALQPPDFQLDADRLGRQAIESDAGIAIVVNPNNPTSLAVPRSELVRLARELGRHGIMLIIDESFIDFTRGGREVSLADQLEDNTNLAIIKSLSKCYGIGGLRLGYLLTLNGELLGAVRREIPIWNINGFADAFLRIAPRYRAEFARSCELVMADRDDLYRRLDAIPGLHAYRPDANFVLCRLPDEADDGPDVTRRLFIQANILIKHCAGKTMPEAERYLRIAARTRRENAVLAEALQRVLGQPQTSPSAPPRVRRSGVSS